MRRPDFAAPAGFLIGFLALAGGALLEGIRLTFFWQPTAAIIVLGGTLGAILVRRGAVGIKSLLRATKSLFFRETDDELNAILARLAWLSRRARLEGVKVYEEYADKHDDPLVSRALTLAAEYQDPATVRAVMDQLLDAEHEAALRESSTLEAAGAYAPTFGILGAVFGLIHVLRSIDEPATLGAGIATAFVATVYGLALANLVLFPLASRLRERHEARIKRREALAGALVALASNASPVAMMNQFSIFAPQEFSNSRPGARLSSLMNK
jgi:chemotaxis protein MotA